MNSLLALSPPNAGVGTPLPVATGKSVGGSLGSPSIVIEGATIQNVCDMFEMKKGKEVFVVDVDGHPLRVITASDLFRMLVEQLDNSCEFTPWSNS